MFDVEKQPNDESLFVQIEAHKFARAKIQDHGRMEAPWCCKEKYRRSKPSTKCLGVVVFL